MEHKFYLCANLQFPWAEAAHAQEGKARIVQRRDRYAMTVSEFKRRRQSRIAI